MNFIMTNNAAAIKKLYAANFKCICESNNNIHIFINDASKKIVFSDDEKVTYTNKMFV